MNITTQQALQVLLDNGIEISVNGGFTGFASSVLSTLIGAVAGGWIALQSSKIADRGKVLKKFEWKLIELKKVVTELEKKLEQNIIGNIEYAQEMMESVNSLFEEIEKEYVEVNESIEELIEIIELIMNYTNDIKARVSVGSEVIIDSKAIINKINKTIKQLRYTRNIVGYSTLTKVRKITRKYK